MAFIEVTNHYSYLFAGEGKQYKKEGLRTEMYFKKRIRLNSSQRANLISLYIGVLLSDQRNNGTCRDHNFFMVFDASYR